MEAQLAKGSFGHLLCSESPRPSSSVWKQVEVLAPQLTNKGSLIDEEDNMREGGSDANNGTVAMTASSPKPSTKRPKKDEEMVYIQVHTSALPASQQLLTKLSDRPNPSGARSLQTLTAFVPKCGRDPLCTGPNQHCGHCKHLKVGGAAAAKRAAVSCPRHDHTKLHHRLMCIRPYGCVYGRTTRSVHEICAQPIESDLSK